FIVFTLLQDIFPGSYLPFLEFFIGTQSAIRLAKFNIDTRQSDRFIGDPTPANGLLISTLPFMAERFLWADSLLANGWFLPAFSFVFAMILTVELPVSALKFTNFGFKDNNYRYLTIGIFLLCVLILGVGGVPLAIISNVGLSVVENLENRNVQNQELI